MFQSYEENYMIFYRCSMLQISFYLLLQYYFFVFFTGEELLIYTSFTYIFLIIIIILIITLTCLYCVKKQRDGGWHKSNNMGNRKTKFHNNHDEPTASGDEIFTIDPRHKNGHSIPATGSSFRPPESTFR